MSFLTTFAETAEAAEQAAGNGDIFSALGIDWRLLILQIVAFLILVVLLGKFVYPWLMKQVDERQANIEAAATAATKAQEDATNAHAKTAELLTAARKEAADIVSTAKLEASELSLVSEKKAKQTAEKIVDDARQQLAKDVEAARKMLRAETVTLVADATAKVVGKTHNQSADEALILQALEESR